MADCDVNAKEVNEVANGELKAQISTIEFINSQKMGNGK